MSSYITKARNKKTGEEVNCLALDDYFGRRRYGYQIEKIPKPPVLTQEQFSKDWEEVI